MSIFTESEERYNILNLGYDNSLTKTFLDPQGNEITPELGNAFTSGLAAKNLLSGEINAKLGGSLDEVFKVDSQGIYLGDSEFSEAPFSVDMQGNLIADSITIGNRQLTVAAGEDIQTAIDIVNTAGGGRVFLSAGTHNVSSNITCYTGVDIEGENFSTTIIDFGSASVGFQLTGTSVYTTGTISSITGGVSVEGSGTSWSSSMVGQQIFINNRWYEIVLVTDSTHLTLASGYADGATYSGNYRISTPISNVTFSSLTIKNSGTTSIIGTDIRDIGILNCQFIDNNKGWTLTNFMNVILDTVSTISSTSNGYELTNGSFCNSYSNASVSNGGHGVVLNNIKACGWILSASDSNTTDGFNCTDVVNCLFKVEASSNGGQGVELVSGCNSNFFNDFLCSSNTSDGIKLTATDDSNTIGASAIITSNGGYGINIAASTCDNNTILAPYLSGNTSGDVNDSGTGTIRIQKIPSLEFGDGSDGDVTISGDTTLTRDMYYHNITINSGINFYPVGYIIYYTGTFTNNGNISGVGNNASGQTGGAALANGNIFGALAGKNGGNGGPGGSGIGSPGSAGGTGSAQDPSFSSVSGQSGSQGGSAPISDSGRPSAVAGGATTLRKKVQLVFNANNPYIGSTIIGGPGGSSGSNGGDGGNQNGGHMHTGAGGVGGGSGSNSRMAFFMGRNFINSSTGTISYTGGNGGDGAAGSGASAAGEGNSGGVLSGAGGGGGPGGQGGFLFFYCNSFVNQASGTMSIAGGTGGTGGTGGNGVEEASASNHSVYGGNGGNGGNGGHGGQIIIGYITSYTNSGTITVSGGVAGTGGTAGTASKLGGGGGAAFQGAAGSSGSTGTVGTLTTFQLV